MSTALSACQSANSHRYDLATYACVRCGRVLPGEPLHTLALRRSAAFVVRYVGGKLSRGSSLRAAQGPR